MNLALENASRILPIVLTVHGVSAANNLYWPEMYTNLSIVDPNNKNPFFDTPSPKVFGNVSPMDPQLFLRINDFAEELLKGDRSGKYTPIEYAQWIEDYADAADKHLADAEATSRGKQRPEFRRMAIDVSHSKLDWPFLWSKISSRGPLRNLRTKRRPRSTGTIIKDVPKSAELLG